MQSFIEKQFKKEQAYVWKNHLGGCIQFTSEPKQIEDVQVQVWDAKFLGKKYKVYRDMVDGITFIPADLTNFTDDFGPIIQYSQNIYGKPAFSFSSMERTNGTIKTRTYSFSTSMSEQGLPQMLCNFGIVEDENNNLQQAFMKSGKSLAHFIASNDHHAAARDPETITVKVEKDKQTTRWNAGIYNLQSMTKEQLEDYFSFPYDSADRRSTMTKLAEAIYQNELEKKNSKQKQKA